MPTNLENSAVATGLEKVSFHSSPKGNAKESSNYHTIALISHASKVMLKILQARLQQSMNCELPDVQTGFWKGRGIKDQIANVSWIIEKTREFQKNTYFCFIDYAKSFDCVGHHTLQRILKEMGIPDHLTCLLRNLYAGQDAQLELDMEQQTGSKLGKEYIKAVYCHPAYLTYMQRTSWETLGWMKHKLESRLLGEISITSDMWLEKEMATHSSILAWRIPGMREPSGLQSVGSHRVIHDWSNFAAAAAAADMLMTLPLWQKVRKNKRASGWKWKKRVKNLA